MTSRLASGEVTYNASMKNKSSTFAELLFFIVTESRLSEFLITEVLPLSHFGRSE